VVEELSYKQLANHVYGLIVFPDPAVYSNPYSNPLTGCSKAVIAIQHAMCNLNLNYNVASFIYNMQEIQAKTFKKGIIYSVF
jgi:hypothetical protein